MEFMIILDVMLKNFIIKMLKIDIILEKKEFIKKIKLDA